MFYTPYVMCATPRKYAPFLGKLPVKTVIKIQRNNLIQCTFPCRVLYDIWAAWDSNVYFTTHDKRWVRFPYKMLQVVLYGIG